MMIRKLDVRILVRTAAILFLAASTGMIAAQSASHDPLPTYTTCHFSDGLQIVQTDPLAPGINSREVETDSGSRQIDLNAGIRVMFAYPDTDFYANVKSELLPAASYPELKQSLIDNFQHLAHGNIINNSLHSLNGFEAHGLDREKLEGGVLGVYLLFDDRTHVVTTIYLLNQEPQARKFQTIEEYRLLRDRFLASYSSCIRGNERGTRSQNPH